MSYIKTQLGDVTVVVEDVSLTDLGSDMVDTSGSWEGADPKEVDGLLEKVAPVISRLAGAGSAALASVPAPSAPDEMKVGLSMGYSSELNAWVLKGNASLTFNIEMKWKNGAGEDRR